MASLVGQSQNVLDFEGIEIEIDGALLMSLLEEDEDEGRLNRVMESLQAEISSPGSMCDDGSVMEQDGVGFSWVDEMEMVVPSSPSEEMNWYMDNYGNDMDVGLADFGVVADYSMICNGAFHLEGSLWQEEEESSYSYDTSMYGSTLC